jgi:phosphatidylglycerophosphate synthase
MNEVDMKKARREGREYVTHALRYLSRPISKLLLRYTKVTPNQVTVFSFLMGILSGIFLLQGGYKNHLIAAGFAMLYILFDLMDGEIARVRNMTSDFGKWLDGVFGIIMTPYLLFCLTFGLKNYLALVIGSIAMVCYPIQYALMYYYKFDIVKSDEKIKLPSKISNLRRLYGSVTFYPLLTSALVLNKGFYLLLFYAVFGNLFWVLVLFTQYLNLKK